MKHAKHIYLRLIEESDLELLLQLRLNENLNKHLNPIKNDKDSQLEWLKNYKKREDDGVDYYFVITDKVLGDLGLVRVYDIDLKNESFTWGSWVIKEDHPKYSAIESALLIYEFSFHELNLSLAKFVVNNDNSAVIKFHKNFGAKHLFADETNNHFELSKNSYIQMKYRRYYKFLMS